MSFFSPRSRPKLQTSRGKAVPEICQRIRGEFSAYLDSTISGREMGLIAAHLKNCSSCARDFAVWQTMGTALAELGPARAPEHLQSRLRSIAAAERVQGAHLSVARRLVLLWESTLAPLALRTAGGAAFALVLAFCLSWIFGPAVAVQANDDRLTHLIAPRYLYSEVLQQPVTVDRDVPVLVDAKVDERGRVYDFTLLEGPPDAETRVRIEANLLSSVFKPASLFGEPVRGHVMLTFTGVSARP